MYLPLLYVCFPLLCWWPGND